MNLKAFAHLFEMPCHTFILPCAVVSTPTDSIHQPQKAVGRTKAFDQQAAEQTTASVGRDTGQLPLKSKGKAQGLEDLEDKTTTTTQGSKYNFSSNCHTLR